MRKSVSMSNLSHYASVVANPPSPPEHSGSGATPDGYVSDGLVQTSNNARERKKGVPWTEEEHRLFLLGLQKLGKGDWRGISRNFVQTRTPTQVASHAQKYFIRQSNLNKRKRRSSLFDIISETVCPFQMVSMYSHQF
jgi:SHAQKYF class myb-like DNA-binding protein